MSVQYLKQSHRRAAILPLLAISLVAIIGVVALAVDLGTLALAKNQLQNAADAAAFAGARALNTPSANTPGLVNAAASSVLVHTKILNETVHISTGAGIQMALGTYTYSDATQKFVANYGPKGAAEPYGAVKADIRITKPNTFAKIFNASAFAVNATAQAVHRPRDIAMILDFSGSMRFDSLPTFPHISYQPIGGSMNPDIRVPKFAYYAGVQGDIKRGGDYQNKETGEVQKVCNLTTPNAETGVAIVNDFYSVPGGAGTIAAYTPGAGHLNNAVKAFWDQNTANVFSEYFSDQKHSGFVVGGGGDKWPAINGIDPRKATGVAQNAAEFFGISGTIGSSTRYNANEDGVTRKISPHGYTWGPGYYGKTFYIWPPDPNHDWRKLYFNALGGATLDNATLYDSNGNFKSAAGNYSIDYTAVIQWLKYCGFNPFQYPGKPDNLYAGRILYYNSIPETIPKSGGTDDQKFWRAYIDYVLGAGCQDQVGYGINTKAWGTIRVTPASQLSGNTTGTGKNAVVHSRPYMHYKDNVKHPLSNFWFGPLTMMSFLADYKTGRNWLPGTAHEAPTWQLKSVVNSVLTEVEKNHPNDRVALVLFSDAFKETWSPISENMTVKRDRLYYPKEVIDKGLPYIRPFGGNFNKSYLGTINEDDLEDGQWDDQCKANVPNAQGSTNPEMGFMLASNEINEKVPNKGRKGSKKVFIFETDGVPNRHVASNTKTDGNYINIVSVRSSEDPKNDKANADDNALKTLADIKKEHPSLKVHSIGFGTLFEPGNGGNVGKAKQFLAKCQGTGIDAVKIIIGNKEVRKTDLLEKLRSIMQGDIAITLIE